MSEFERPFAVRAGGLHASTSMSNLLGGGSNGSSQVKFSGGGSLWTSPVPVERTDYSRLRAHAGASRGNGRYLWGISECCGLWEAGYAFVGALWLWDLVNCSRLSALLSADGFMLSFSWCLVVMVSLLILLICISDLIR